jgi:hypothetical protein
LVLSSKKYFSPSHPLTTSTVVLLILIAFFLTLKPLIFFHIYIYCFVCSQWLIDRIIYKNALY